jgi:hypothetical protein
MMTDTYVELEAINLKCLCMSVKLQAENKPIEQITFCGVQDYPGPVKWHLVMKLAQTFDPGGTDTALQLAINNYAANGAPAPFKVRPFGSRPAAINNPEYTGFAIPQPYDIFGGDAGAASEVDIDWILTTPPVRGTGTAVPATTASAGTPGQFSPAGCTVPANLAGLSGVTASPTATWGAGQYVVTADLLAANWNGTAWVAGKHP